MDSLELALDDCLRQLGSGRSSLAQCLARYPQYAAELRPLLETALRVQQGRNVRPTGAARDRTRRKINGYIESHPQEPRGPGRVPRLAFPVLALVLTFAFVTTAFAQAALPGQALYNLKLTSEHAWRSIGTDPVGMDLGLADRRTQEILTLAQMQAHAARDDQGAAQAEMLGISAYTEVLNRLADESQGPQGTRILTELRKHREKLMAAGVHIPKLDEICARAQDPATGQNGHTP